MGIVSALFVILLSVSGFVVHHSAELNLGQRFTDSPALLAWYAIEAPEVSVSYKSEGHTLALLADAIYFDSLRLPGSFSSLVGLLTVDFGFVAAMNNQLLLLTADGELIEILSGVNGVPPGIEAIGSNSNGNVYLRVGREDGVILADLNTLEWTIVPETLASDVVQWSEQTKLSEDQAGQIQSHYVSTLLNWDRVILDIHSGRFLGGLGVLLVDIMALLFVLMAISGVWIWSRRRS